MIDALFHWFNGPIARWPDVSVPPMRGPIPQKAWMRGSYWFSLRSAKVARDAKQAPAGGATI